MTPVELQADYPTLARIHSGLQPQPALAGSRLEELHENLFGGHVHEVELALARLLARFDAVDLAEQIRGVFSAQWNAWDAARTELMALATLDEDGVLDSVAWPRGAGSAPFDAVVTDVRGRGALVAVDVKSGQGVGTFLLVQRLTPIAERWATALGLGPVEIEIEHHGGALTQENLQNHVGRLMADFRAALAPFRALPPAPIPLVLDAYTTLEVDVQPGIDVRVHAGVGSPAARTASILRVMASHEAHKAVCAAANQRHFVLVYVSPTGAGGADFQADNVVDAARQMAPTASPWWLGTVFLDWTAGALTRVGFFRQDGTWPAGSSEATLRGTFQCP